MHRIANAIIIFAALSLCGCVALPLNNDGIDDPALQQIAQAYENTIASTENDPEREWQSGWTGNMWIHHKGQDSNQAGLCYEWKYLVHAGVAETVTSVGWEARGIAIRENTTNEHHAVLVFDPARVSEGSLLSANPTDPVFILDAWRQGKPDIYRLADWLDEPPHDELKPRIFIISKK